MSLLGFAMLLINAYGYIFDGHIKHPAMTIMGLIFVVMGLKMLRKTDK